MHSKQNASVATLFASTMTLMLLMQSAQAQTFSVLHNFTEGAGGANPEAGVTFGPSGVLYGTAAYGGTHNNYGTVFKLSQVNSSWVFSPLYEFIGGFDGAVPYGGVAIGPNGALYGTAETRGVSDQGTVFELRPPFTVCKGVLCYWNQAVVHAFAGYPVDGAEPQVENLVFDQAGNIYGTTEEGGMYGGGTVFQLTPLAGGYTESILYSFAVGVTVCTLTLVSCSIPPEICTEPLMPEEPERPERFISSCRPAEAGWKMFSLTSAGRMGLTPTVT